MDEAKDNANPNEQRVLPALGSDTKPGMLIRDRRGRTYYVDVDRSMHRIPDHACTINDDGSILIHDPELSAHINALKAKYGEV